MTDLRAPEVLDRLIVARLTCGSAEAVVLRVPGVPDDAVPGGSSADRSPADLPDVLDDAERERMSRYLRAADRARYHVAHTALRLVLGARLDLPPAALRFDRAACPGCGEPHGRPVLAVGHLQQRAEFSISHGGGLAAVAVAPAGVDVGVDVEPVVPARTSDEIIASLHPREQELVAQADPAGRAAAFTRIWSRKEAYLKGLGIGLGRSLAADDLTVAPPGWDLAERDVDNHKVALAVKSTVRDLAHSLM
ncbi:4'-phosphopantetheinyl transferase family protein [Myceligenerans crystallogenes]|uniref:4'-phosphopantetheinyl transferase domain-containing protein n=1 Tax=Myceligenerans crystallogenes TaxID=316335 RepID=A0ABN2NH41_9MICO